MSTLLQAVITFAHVFNPRISRRRRPTRGLQKTSATLAAVIALTSSPAHAIVIYVDDDALSGGDGLTWNTAHSFLQDALVFANVTSNGVTEIRIAQGVYRPDRTELNPAGTGDRAAFFRPVNGVPMLGGFAGIGAVDPDARDIAAFETILSGDLAGDDQPHFVNNVENSSHVVRRDTGGTVALDGLTIAGGNAVIVGGAQFNVERWGGGAWINGAIAEFHGCTFRQNIANDGGGLAAFSTGAVITLAECTFEDNRARRAGGVFAASPATVAILGCEFRNNMASSTIGGGAAYFQTHVSITDSTFENNAAPLSDGGALRLEEGTITQCVFRNNTAQRGGALGAENSDFVVSLCNFDSNTAAEGGAVFQHRGLNRFEDCHFLNNLAHRGGAIAMQVASPTFIGCLFESNSAEQGGAMAIQRDEGGFSQPSAPSIQSCTFRNNLADSGGAILVSTSDPLLIGCRFESNIATTYGGGIASFGVPGATYVLSQSHPHFYNCILWNNEALKGGAVYSNTSISTLTNCTIVNNRASQGGAALTHNSASIRVYNSIIRANVGGTLTGAGIRSVRYTNISNGHIGTGNIDVNPRFVNWLAGDVRIRPGSPCIDAGRNAYLPAFVTTDIAGQARFRDDPASPNTGVGSPAVVDIGAYEF